MEKLNLGNNLLKVLSCPMCSTTLDLSEDRKELNCSRCGCSFAVRHGIPVLFPDDDEMI